MTAAIRRIAAQVYDQDAHDERDLAFLQAIGEADEMWHEALQRANKEYGGGTQAWEAVKNLATRQRDADYAKAMEAYFADDENEILIAAE